MFVKKDYIELVDGVWVNKNLIRKMDLIEMLNFAFDHSFDSVHKEDKYIDQL